MTFSGTHSSHLPKPRGVVSFPVNVCVPQSHIVSEVCLRFLRVFFRVLGCFLGFCLGLDVCFGLGLGVDFGLRCFFANLRRALPNEMGLFEGIRLEGIR